MTVVVDRLKLAYNTEHPDTVLVPISRSMDERGEAPGVMLPGLAKRQKDMNTIGMPPGCG